MLTSARTAEGRYAKALESKEGRGISQTHRNDILNITLQKDAEASKTSETRVRDERTRVNKIVKMPFAQRIAMQKQQTKMTKTINNITMGLRNQLQIATKEQNKLKEKIADLALKTILQSTRVRVGKKPALAALDR